MRLEKSIREKCSHRLNLVEIYKNHTVYLCKLKETEEKSLYIEAENEESANAYKIGCHIIDAVSKTNYRIFSNVSIERKRKGKEVYSVKLEDEIEPGEQKRKMIRLYTSIDDTYYMTSILRFYEIVYIIHTLRTHKENRQFWKWIECDDRKLQINHITGEYDNSGNTSTLEICTRYENLVHGTLLRYFRKVNDVTKSVFLATAKDCCLAKEQLMNATGEKKVATSDVYSLLVQQNKVVSVF